MREGRINTPILNAQRPFTVYLSPFTIRLPFTVYRDLLLTANGKRTVNGKQLMVNASVGGIL
jgi:hypothetical protein